MTIPEQVRPAYEHWKCFFGVMCGFLAQDQ